MTRVRMTSIKTRTNRGLAIVRDARDGRRNRDRTDTCIDQRRSSARLGSTFQSVDEVGRALAVPIISLRAAGRLVMVTLDFARIPTLASLLNGIDES